MIKLDTPIEKISRCGTEEKAGLNRLGLFTVKDILYYFPVKYSNASEKTLIKDLEIDTHATVIGTIREITMSKSFKTKIPMSKALVEDISSDFEVTWFNQPYITRMFPAGSVVEITGKVTAGKNGPTILNPEIKKTASMPIDNHNSLFQSEDGLHTNFGFPIYKETKGVTSRFIYHLIEKIFKSNVLEQVHDLIPQDIIKKYSLPTLRTALVWIHTPKNDNHAKSSRKRFAFEEIFFIQLKRLHDRKEISKERSYQINLTDKDHKAFLKRFSFTPTNAQTNAIETILKDIANPHPMSRLLEGDVGSGKTAVAAVASLATVLSRPEKQNFGNLQVAYMAPTEILATQHFENFIKYFENMGLNIGLITGSGCRKFPSKNMQTRNMRESISDKTEKCLHRETSVKQWTEISRTQLLKWVANGEIPILIGTHALIQKSVKFKHLALAIVDEQHRFGREQRRKLAQKDGVSPHFLSMTATPIPRTLALTIYGDLDLTLLDQMPPGRKEIITEIILPHKRDTAYEEIKKQIKSGRQVYVICPRIDIDDSEEQLKTAQRSVVQEATRLKKDIFPDCVIDILHSKMTPKKKDEVMKNFSEGRIDILVATSVVEVGVNVPNATVIIIEGAERFGLAQLHQLRGRVIRGTHQAYCYIFTESKTDKTKERLHAFTKAKNGFELAELDLTIRGAGELSGTKQWGVTDLGMEAIKNIKMVEAARLEAKKIIDSEGELEKNPAIKKMLDELVSKHFE